MTNQSKLQGMFHQPDIASRASAQSVCRRRTAENIKISVGAAVEGNLDDAPEPFEYKEESFNRKLKTRASPTEK